MEKKMEKGRGKRRGREGFFLVSTEKKEGWCLIPKLLNFKMSEK